ncbi:MAG: DUF4364 family protein [Lachnospiraceae bacterium]|nr:DUF4364 family protein [Lachnospiraceae bacterium]
MQPESLMLNKLIILYILNNVNFPLTNSQLTDLILDKEYASYFNIQQSLADLVEDGYVRMDTVRSDSLYKITDSGKETLSFFSNTISPAIRAEIDEYLLEKELNLREEVSVPSEFFEGKKDEFVTRLRVIERGSSIFEINLAVPSREEAELICRNWKEASSELYELVLARLLHH